MNDFPALYDVSRRTWHPLRGRDSFTVGRSTDADLPVTDVRCFPAHFRVRRVGDRFAVEPLTAEGPTFHNGKTLAGQTWLVHGAVLQAGGRQFRFLERPEAAGDGPPPAVLP